ncbi:MAG: hypothetical protein ICV78_01325 [Tolypothrix sp. Co-bin9]|nr:hypothetical protein [Tolypothrix sp. Co-bin9]
MFCQSSIKHSSQNIPNSPSWQKMVVELDESNEESLCGGSKLTQHIRVTDNPPVVAVLLFANPFSA